MDKSNSNDTQHAVNDDGVNLGASSSSPADAKPSKQPCRVYDSSIYLVITLQAVLFIMSALTLDMGALFRQWTIAMAAYWPMAILIMVRSKDKPSQFDMITIRWSFPILMFLVVPFADLVIMIVTRGLPGH